MRNAHLAEPFREILNTVSKHVVQQECPMCGGSGMRGGLTSYWSQIEDVRPCGYCAATGTVEVEQ